MTGLADGTEKLTAYLADEQVTDLLIESEIVLDGDCEITKPLRLASGAELTVSDSLMIDEQDSLQAMGGSIIRNQGTIENFGVIRMHRDARYIGPRPHGTGSFIH